MTLDAVAVKCKSARIIIVLRLFWRTRAIFSMKQMSSKTCGSEWMSGFSKQHQLKSDASVMWRQGGGFELRFLIG